MSYFYYFFSISFLSILLLNSCEPAAVNNISVNEVKNHSDYSFLDVRTPKEFQNGAVPGAINIDVMNDNFLSEIEKLNKDDKYIIYCRSGKRSLDAYGLMTNAGFKNLLNLEGGYVAYTEQ